MHISSREKRNSLWGLEIVHNNKLLSLTQVFHYHLYVPKTPIWAKEIVSLPCTTATDPPYSSQCCSIIWANVKVSCTKVKLRLCFDSVARKGFICLGLSYREKVLCVCVWYVICMCFWFWKKKGGEVIQRHRKDVIRTMIWIKLMIQHFFLYCYHWYPFFC